MNRKSTIDSILVPVPATPVAVNSPKRVQTGAIAGMRSHLSGLTESAITAARLQEQMSAGESVVELDPALLDGSMVVDRIVMDVDPNFDELVDSIQSAGQQVPILVRPSGERYQIAYGHRRVRAAKRLGIKVKALVRDLTNDQLVVAQGKENNDRKDLSFIEKAQFARHLEDQGYERPVIMAALSTEKGNLSRYIGLARSIPEKLVHAIGPASKAGRWRWVALAEQMPGKEQLVEAAIRSEQFKTLDSDARFSLVLKALSEPVSKETTWVGGKAARIERKEHKVVLTIDEAGFGDFVAERMGDLYREYLDRKAA